MSVRLLQRVIRLTPAMAGRRLDQILVELFPQFSRARIQQWLRRGEILLDQAVAKPAYRVLGYERLEVEVELEAPLDQTTQAEAIAIDVLYDDQDLAVVNKAAGMVVHPAAGNWAGTLQNALLFRWPHLNAIPRAGIVHRLDKLTSGVMIVAKSLAAHHALVAQLQARQISRRYLALVHGALVSGGTVDAPLGRHPKDRKKMAVVKTGKAAVSHYRIGRRYRDFTLLQISLESGRTHQIRVHMRYLGYPLVGDPVYGGRARRPPGAGDQLLAALSTFQRQALHAWQLRFRHPLEDRVVAVESSPPADFNALLAALDDDPRQQAT